MARRDSVNPANVDGPWFVDTQCIRCDVARHWAPGLIEMDDSGLSFVARQPESADDIAAMWRAAKACPTQSIGNVEGNDAALISPGTFAVPVPGHTEGSVAFHIDNRWLFTGDTLHWNHRRSELDVTPEQTFYSWAALADSMDRMSALRVEWVFPGHGMWHDVGTDLYTAQPRSTDEVGRGGFGGVLGCRLGCGAALAGVGAWRCLVGRGGLVCVLCLGCVLRGAA